MKKKIIICCEFFYPSKGGVQEHLLILSKYLVKQGYKVEIATSIQKKNKERKKLKKIKINKFNIEGSLIRGYSGNTNDYQKFLINSDYNYYLFYAAQQWSFDLALPVIDKIHGKKIFLPCGFPKLNNIFYKIYYNFILKSEINNFDNIILFSRSNFDYKFCKKFYKKKINIISNGGFKNLKKKNKSVSKILNILNVSNFGINKNQIMLIFISLFLKRTIQITFVFSKKNYYYFLCNFFIKIITKLKANIKFKFLYNPTRKNIMKEYVNNDLFVFTSLIECAPLVIIDCILSDLNFVSYNVGNIKELISQHKIGHLRNSFIQFLSFIEKFQKQKIISKNKKKLTWDIILPKYKKVIEETKQF